MKNKVVCALALVIALALPRAAGAAPWAIVATNFAAPDVTAGEFWDDREGIFTVDLGGSTPHLYGPFLQGILSDHAGGGVLDVAKVPGSPVVLISNFGGSLVYRVNVANPRNPVITGVVEMKYDTVDEFDAPVTYTFFAEDIAVSPDGSFAIVTDGGLSEMMGFIDLRTFTLTSIQKLSIPDPANPSDPTLNTPVDAQAVAIARDGRTVLFADYFGKTVHYGRVNASRSALKNIRSLFICDNVDPLDSSNCLGTEGWPVNIAISPDGRTALVALTFARSDPNGANLPVDGVVAALRITRTGRVLRGKPFLVTGVPPIDALTTPGESGGGNQSIVFHPRGRVAYVFAQPVGEVPDPSPEALPGDMVNRLSVVAKLRIGLRPGRARVTNADFAEVHSRGSGQYFGVDTLAISRGGGWLLASNPTSFGVTNVLTIIRSGTGRRGSITLPSQAVPAGVVFK